MIKPRRTRSPKLWAWPMAALSALAGLAVAAHYPLGPALAMAVFLLVAALAWRYWTWTPCALALLPVIGLAPWTGWLVFEEFDLLMLACASGGYLALALGGEASDPVPSWRRPLSFSPAVRVLILAFAASVLLAITRGFADAGGFQFGWFQGYHEPMNSLRSGKSYLLALWMLPLWLRVAVCHAERFKDAVLFSMVSVLALASAAALWERAAFPGVMNFSSDYRTSALFWEMHVGGAAFDGCLALTLPFALHLLLRAKRGTSFALALGLMLLATYACLTTFSRGVYLAIPLGLVVYGLLRFRQGLRVASATPSNAAMAKWAPLTGTLLLSVYGLAAFMMFEAGGYRALLALLGVSVVFVLTPEVSLPAKRSQSLASMALGFLVAMPLAALFWALSSQLPKAAYGVYALVFVLALGQRVRARPASSSWRPAFVADALWFSLLAASVLVADHWSEGQGGRLAAMAMALPAVLSLLFRLAPRLWPFTHASGLAGWKARAGVLGALLMLMAMISTLMAGSYMRDRSASSSDDMRARLMHWHQGLSLLNTPSDRWLGKGSGRFVDQHFFMGPASEQTGDYRIQSEAGKPYLRLSAGKHVQGWGEMFRVSQRMAAPQGRVQLKVRLRTSQELRLHSEICEKHLLYNENCLIQQAHFGGQPEVWQTRILELGQASGMGGAVYAPRLIAFSVAVETPGVSADIAELQLLDERGQPLLKNGDFGRDMAHWFFSSDRHHMPWHIKQMALHVWFEQGLLGLGLLTALVSWVLVRLSIGRGRGHELAPAVAAGLVGFLLVGLFDSLLDAPRMAFLFYVLTLLGLGLRGTPSAEDPARA